MPAHRHRALQMRAHRRDQDAHVRSRQAARQGRIRGGVRHAGPVHGRKLRGEGGREEHAREGTREGEDPHRDSHPPRMRQRARRPVRPMLRGCETCTSSWSSAATARWPTWSRPEGGSPSPSARRTRARSSRPSRTSTRTGSYTGTSSSVTCSSPRGTRRSRFGRRRPPRAAAEHRATSAASAGGGPGSDPALDDSVATGGRLKIGDFGLACRVESDDERKTTICGTPNYIAPEVLAGSKGGGHSYEVDVWSIGVIIYTLLVGTPPFQTSDVHATYKRIRANAYEFPEGVVNEGARELIRRCLAPKPGDRPKIAEIAAHPLLNAGWRGATPWSMPTPRVDADKMERSTRSGEIRRRRRGQSRERPSVVGGRSSRRAPLSPLTVADPSAPRTARAERKRRDAAARDARALRRPRLGRGRIRAPRANAGCVSGGLRRRRTAAASRRGGRGGGDGVAGVARGVHAADDGGSRGGGGSSRGGGGGSTLRNRRQNVDAKTSTSAPIDPAEFATLGMDSPSDGRLGGGADGVRTRDASR